MHYAKSSGHWQNHYRSIYMDIDFCNEPVLRNATKWALISQNLILNI